MFHEQLAKALQQKKSPLAPLFLIRNGLFIQSSKEKKRVKKTTTQGMCDSDKPVASYGWRNFHHVDSQYIVQNRN